MDASHSEEALAAAVIEELRSRNAIPDTGQTEIKSTVGLIVCAGSAGDCLPRSAHLRLTELTSVSTGSCD
jgi:hypothetical protein